MFTQPSQRSSWSQEIATKHRESHDQDELIRLAISYLERAEKMIEECQKLDSQFNDEVQSIKDQHQKLEMAFQELEQNAYKIEGERNALLECYKELVKACTKEANFQSDSTQTNEQS